MTQNNLYMENDELTLSVDVQPILIDELENYKNQAQLSAAQATQSANNANTWLNAINDCKAGIELFSAQSINNLRDLVNTAITDITALKNNVVQTLEECGHEIISQAQSYANQAEEAVNNRVSIDHLNQSKALSTGMVSSDEEVFSEVINYAHSTFDPSKFTVVGNPTITNDGIASGFSLNDYLKLIQVGSLAGKSWRIEDNFTVAGNLIDYTLNLSESSQEFGNITVSNYGLYFSYYIGDNSDYNFGVISLVGIPSGNYKYFLEFNKETSLYTLGYSDLDGSNVHTTTYTPTVANKELFTVNTRPTEYMILGNRIDYTAALPTDLKQISVTANSLLLFSGNKTGIDTIKTNDYTVVGTPTISADGVMTGVTNTAITTSSVPPIQTASTWEFQTKTTYKSGTQHPAIMGSSDTTFYHAPHIHWYNDGWDGNYLCIWLSSNGNDFDIVSVGASSLKAQEGQTYWIKIGYNGTAYYIDYNTDGSENYTNAFYLTTNKKQYCSVPLMLMNIDNNLTNYANLGTMDLNETKLFINNNLYWQPCLKIPYTESKTGSKIVQSVYRDRVKDMCNQFGYAPYYTLSDTDFTLPMGEIYGMIEKLRNSISQLST